MSLNRWQSARNSPIARYGFSVVLVLAALALHLALGDLLVVEFNFLLFFAALVVVAWLVGLGPALLATGLSILAVEYFLLDPAGAFRPHPGTAVLALLSFGGVALLVSRVAESRRRALADLAGRNLELERQAAELESRRTETERALKRSRLLSDASRVLTAPLDQEVRYQELARLVVSGMADYCVTYIVDPRGTIRRVSVAHADPEAKPLVDRLLSLTPPTVEDEYGAGAVIRTGDAVLARTIPDELLEESTQGREHLEAIRALRPISSMILPLRARGRTVGAIAFATTAHSGRHYDEEDMEVAWDLAAHAALALDNARLYRQARDEVRERERAEEALRRREEQLRALLDHAPDLILRFDDRFRCLFVNPAVEEATGIPLNRIPGRTIRHLGIGPTLADRWEGALAWVFSSGESHSLEFRLRTRAGHRWYHARVVPELERDGSVGSVLSIARDITDRKVVESRRELLVEAGRIFTTSLDFATTLEDVGELVTRGLADLCAVALVDEKRMLERMAVVARDPEVKELVEEMHRRFPPDLEDPGHPVSRVLDTGESVTAAEVSVELLQRIARNPEHLSLLGRLKPRTFVVVPLPARGRIFGTLVAVRTGKAQPFGPEDAALLEELGVQAALALDNARLFEERAKAVRAREEVLAVVAHDLRNPLSSIASAAAALARPVGESERRRLLGLLRRQAERADRLIGDLLDVSKIEAGRFSVELEPVAVERLLAEACESASLRARERGIRIEWGGGEGVEVLADGPRILQLLGNLLDNALKVSAPGDRVEVRAAARGLEVVFSVADDGPGIRDEDLPHLFDRFWQGRRRSGGTAGLGLAIVRGIVEAHGGRVWVESRPEGGSRFFFTLPVSPGPGGFRSPSRGQEAPRQVEEAAG